MQRGGRRSRCVTALGIIVFLAACGGHPGGGSAAGSQAYCGKTHTAAHVPVRIKVVRGRPSYPEIRSSQRLPTRIS